MPIAPTNRRDLEAEALNAFMRVLIDLGLPAGEGGYGASNRFDAGFKLVGQQRFQFGDLRVTLPDRIVIVEVESGGGLTNLVKYWPHAAATDRPILLLHAFAQNSANDYLSHLLLWDFVWGKMRAELWQQPAPGLFASQFRFTPTDESALATAAKAFNECLSQPLGCVLKEVFSFPPA